MSAKTPEGIRFAAPPLTGADGGAIRAVARRVDAHARSRRCGDGGAEEAARGRPPHRAAELPGATDANLDAIRLDAGAGSDLTPEHELAAAAAGLGDRERERERRNLRPSGD